MPESRRQSPAIAETANDPRSTSGNTAGPVFEVPPGAIYIGPWPSEQFPQPTDLNPDHWVLEPGLCPGGCEIETPAGGWCPACWERVHEADQ
jgi:hypothetical protein